MAIRTVFVAVFVLSIVSTLAQTTPTPAATSASSSSSANTNIGVQQLQKFYEFIRTADSVTYASSVQTMDVNRLIDEATVAMGDRDTQNNFPNWLGTSVRINTVSELLVAICARKLMEKGDLDDRINVQYLPRGLSFTPKGEALTVKMLMQHTSTISDGRFEVDVEAITVASDGTLTGSVMDFSSFIEKYFVTFSGGVVQVNEAIWDSGSSDVTPGTPEAYKYARANTALLAYVVERVIMTKPGLVKSTSKTFMAYAQELIINELGMSGTWVKTRTGGDPMIDYPPSSIFTNKAIKDYAGADTPAGQFNAHPAYPADYMYLSNVEDLSKLIRSLWLDPEGSLKSVGTFLKDQASSFPITAQDGQNRRGMGVAFFDGAKMCSVALTSGIIEKCPLKESSVVWGSVSSGEFSIVGVFCTDTASSINPTCVSVTQSFYRHQGSKKSNDHVLGMAAVAFQQAIGDKSTTSQTSGSGEDTQYYGLWVFFGVVGIITFVLTASYFTEYLIQPAPISTGVAMPTAIPGMNPDNYYNGQ